MRGHAEPYEVRDPACGRCLCVAYYLLATRRSSMKITVLHSAPNMSASGESFGVAKRASESMLREPPDARPDREAPGGADGLTPVQGGRRGRDIGAAL